MNLANKESTDPRYQYLDSDVLQAAKHRIFKILAQYDSVAVAFSGGKDSLALLHLVQQCYDELKWRQKVNVIFRDEELIPDTIVNFVQDIAESDKYNFKYFCLQLKSEKYILGKKEFYIQWDKNRKNLRTPPAYAIVDPTAVYDQYSADVKTMESFKGKKIILTGIRASESLVRRQAIINKKNQPYIAKGEDTSIDIGRPIYDWEENDVFKYFYDQGIKYCPIYDWQLWGGGVFKSVHASTRGKSKTTPQDQGKRSYVL